MKTYDAYYHANAKGTGVAAKFELRPAHEEITGSIFATFAKQETDTASCGASTRFPRFDWENALKVKFDRDDLSQILQVLRGFRESVNEGKGLFHISTNANIVIRFSHEIEPTPGYQFEVVRNDRKSHEQTSIVFRFSIDEAFALLISLERALLYVCFPESVKVAPTLALRGNLHKFRCFGIPEVERAEKAENPS